MRVDPLPSPERVQVWETMLEPPLDCRPIGFWFWNDEIDEASISEQLAAFAASGYGGVVIHPRVGLPPSIGYLTPRFFALVRAAVQQCAALGLQVLLYDEASYPSGSANGAVVAENPAFAARGLARTVRDVRGPWVGYWRPSIGRSLEAHVLTAVVGRLIGGAVDPESIRPLTLDERGLARVALGDGEWRLMACFDRPTRGTIRGAFSYQDDDSAQAPAAGNVLDPDAVACFIRLTHDAYANELGDHFGTTITAFFTDEPDPLGRNSAAGLIAYSPGLELDFARHIGVTREAALQQLPLLWEDSERGLALRNAYDECVHERIRTALFGQLSDWCDRHHLALTGHPQQSNDISCLKPFHWPGQDVVWRWVLPGQSSLEGPHSTSALAAASAARLYNRRRNITEVFGAYGWQLSLDEMKWLLDWHFARGTNTVIVHALFTSIRGGRAFESEPDLGVHHPASRALQHLITYAGRVSWLLTDGTRPAAVAVVGDGHRLPWQAVAILLEHQVEASYVPVEALAAEWAGTDPLGTTYSHVVVDHSNGPVALTREAKRALEALQDQGCPVIHFDGSDRASLDGTLRQGREDLVGPAVPGLRVVRTNKLGLQIRLLFNESEEEITSALVVEHEGTAQWWDPFRGSRVPANAKPGSGGHFPFRIGRRECLVLAVGLGLGPVPEAHAEFAEPRASQELELDVWTVTDEEGHTHHDVQTLGNWARVPRWETFSGTLTYTSTVVLASEPADIEIDLGAVGESCSISVNGTPAGVLLWAPFVLRTPGTLWRKGRNVLQVHVTNSAANAFEGSQLPSGLLGPVRLSECVG